LELEYASDYQYTDGPRTKTDPPGNNSLLRVYVRICSTNYKIVKVCMEDELGQEKSIYSPIGLLKERILL
jgi:hypothetical protein